MKPLKLIAHGQMTEYTPYGVFGCQIPAPRRTVRDWIRRGEVDGHVDGRGRVWVVPNRRLGERFDVYRRAQYELEAARNQAVERYRRRLGKRLPSDVAPAEAAATGSPPPDPPEPPEPARP